MTYGSLADMDAAEERRERREAARAQVRGGPTATPMPVPGNRPRAVVVNPTPAAMPATKAPATASPPAFRLVGELPEPNAGRRPNVPAVRQQLIDFAKANVDQWIEYRSTAADTFKDPSSFSNRVRKGVGGFGPGFEAAVRGGQLYIRYVGTTTASEA
ncbi:hypothetical protein A6F55_23805 [Prescottella equi]|uniref:hypothetical protein n=1 Tax=Rhodococcus hoagii TaxID=43767 RepID=UPI000A10B5F3|nr:hypothetical protein [Prescottella equi]ORJ92591.1 hypothetical protein A6F55_23805 [Prescottella equi]